MVDLQRGAVVIAEIRFGEVAVQKRLADVVEVTANPRLLVAKELSAVFV